MRVRVHHRRERVDEDERVALVEFPAELLGSDRRDHSVKLPSRRQRRTRISLNATQPGCSAAETRTDRTPRHGRFGLIVATMLSAETLATTLSTWKFPARSRPR